MAVMSLLNTSARYQRRIRNPRASVYARCLRDIAEKVKNSNQRKYAEQDVDYEHGHPRRLVQRLTPELSRPTAGWQQRAA